jgi:hypothetical protein
VEKNLLLNLVLFNRSSFFFQFAFFITAPGLWKLQQNTAQHRFLAKLSFFTWLFGGVNLECFAVTCFLALLANHFTRAPMSSSTIVLCRT